MVTRQQSAPATQRLIHADVVRHAKKMKTNFNNHIFEIIEDLPEVGFYLYVYNYKGECIADYLQKSEQDIKEFALEEFGVLLESWT